MMTISDVQAEIVSIRNRLARVPFSLADAEARETAERFCQEAQTECWVPGGLAHARRLVFAAGARVDEIR